MYKYQPIVVLGSLLFLQCTGTQAQDSDKGAPSNDSLPKPVAGESKPAIGAAPVGEKKHKRAGRGDGQGAGGGHHHHHGQFPPMHQVMNLPSLTEKQKQDIGAVYSANDAQFKSLTKQLNELKRAEWEKIQPMLTKDQLSQLRVSGGTGAAADAPVDASATPAHKGR